jgi:DNA helicase II / ATP-dependent DNA helicase PcrA
MQNSEHLQDPGRSITEAETAILDEVQRLLLQQLQEASTGFTKRSEVAREMTSSLVAARTAEDKQLLASDEAVAQGLTERIYEEAVQLEKQQQRPYFARFEIEEEAPSGSMRASEFKIGYRANPAARIVDWRQAPLARLYYEYQEGEEFSETIRDREREGVVTLRRQLEITQGELRRISCPQGTFIKDETGVWKEVVAGQNRTARSYGKLPSILSLITPEQFRLITEDSLTAVILQGLAGSGKTTVALHRLSWMLFNIPDISPTECSVIVRTHPLQAYIKASLASLELQEVPVLLFEEWMKQKLRLDHVVQRDHHHQPLLSAEAVAALEEGWTLFDFKAASTEKLTDLRRLGATFCRSVGLRTAIQHRANASVLQRSFAECADRLDSGNLEGADYTVLLRLSQLGTPQKFTSARRAPLVVDEVQDYTALELACLVGSVKEYADLTLVGDISQQSDVVDSFPGWHSLISLRSEERNKFTFVELVIGHRSTLPIMRLAHALSPSASKPEPLEGRTGKVPQLVLTANEQDGISFICDWIEKSLEREPNSLIAVLCRDTDDARYAAGMLKPRFGDLLRHWTSGSFSLEEGVMIAEISKVKGLEFPSVLIWNPTSRSFTQSRQDQALLYIGVSRAEEELCIVSWQKPTQLLTSVDKSLLRHLDLRPEE